MPLIPYQKTVHETYPPLIYEGQEIDTVCEEKLVPPYEVQGQNLRMNES